MKLVRTYVPFLPGDSIINQWFIDLSHTCVKIWVSIGALEILSRLRRRFPRTMLRPRSPAFLHEFDFLGLLLLKHWRISDSEFTNRQISSSCERFSNICCRREKALSSYPTPFSAASMAASEPSRLPTSLTTDRLKSGRHSAWSLAAWLPPVLQWSSW